MESKKSMSELWKSMTKEQQIEVRKFTAHILINAFIFTAIGTLIAGVIFDLLGIPNLPFTIDIIIFIIIIMSTCCFLYAKESGHKHPGRVYFIILVLLTIIFLIILGIFFYYTSNNF